MRAGAPSPATPRRWTWSFAPWGPQLEAPGLQLAHSQLGRYRFYTLRYEKLLKADLTALVDAFAGIGVDEHRVLYDDNDPLGAAYGRFGQLAWKSRNFDSFFEANLTLRSLSRREHPLRDYGRWRHGDDQGAFGGSVILDDNGDPTYFGDFDVLDLPLLKFSRGLHTGVEDRADAVITLGNKNGPLRQAAWRPLGCRCKGGH